ncbi:MAG: carboxypeptidase regulatory-like domain-containing protein [Planctomycetes bacterium]|nr:carboxypeptidase regulatory-like domain-containing protein [Planctomycetota bacterium]
MIRRALPVVALFAALVVALLWWGASGERDPATSPPDDSVAELDAQSAETLLAVALGAIDAPVIPPEFEVRVIDALAEQPVAGARVHEAGAAAALAVTDESGTARVAAARVGQYTVEADGFDPETFRWGGQTSVTLAIMVTPTESLALRGSVRFAGGAPASGASVLAVPESSSPTREELRSSLRGEGPFLLGTCDADGAFSLEGEWFEVYQLYAAARGHLTPEPVRAAMRPGSAGPTLVLWPAFGAVVRFVSETGAPLESGASAGPGSGPVLRYGEGIQWLRRAHPGLALLGVEPSAVDVRDKPSMIVLLATTASASEVLQQRVDVFASLPGFVPFQQDLHLPLLDGGLKELPLTLRHTDSAPGRVEVLVSPEAAALLAGSGLFPGGLELLLSPSPAGETLYYRIPEFSPEGRAEVTGLPEGRYRATVRNVVDNELLDLAPEDPARRDVELVVTQAGATLDLRAQVPSVVEFVLLDGAGAPVPGRVTLRVGRLSTTGERLSPYPAFFPGPPYRLALFEPGPCYARVEVPWAQELAVDGARNFELEAGRVLRIEARAPR